MDVELSQEESGAVQKALRSYLSDLRMEITDTDNPQYKRELREERASLESAIEKLGSSTATGDTAEGDATGAGEFSIRIVRLFWTSMPA